ncbi:Uma2 family endonuclease [Paludisphaera soli]|uniref:Uma2 family endonuclease n=1 Tax=Paludisphaera soli TaxID=2712865 RepID=UPI0013EB0C66|nr:Uma2 family endonuclease [Paludisphaera soli]
MSVEIDADITTFQDVIDRLGGVPASRILLRPAPGEATEADAIRIHEKKRVLCELVDGVLVEKGMGYVESMLAIFLAGLLQRFVDEHNLGVVTGADGLIRLFPGMMRAPDIAFASWDRIPESTLSRQTSVPDIAPELAVEILSRSNTDREMERKRDDYFNAGVLVVWEVDPRSRTLVVHRRDMEPRTLGESDSLSEPELLPGFELPLQELFGKLDRKRGPA